MVTISLNDKVAIVTGGGSGIGRGICLGLAKAGARAVPADINLKSAEETVALIAEAGGPKAIAVEADVTSASSMEAMVGHVVTTLGGVDILVNNAGIAPSHPLEAFPEEDWDRTVAVNLKGYFLCARAVARQMIRQGRGGHIVNISSKTGVRGSANNSAYNATKFGVIGLAQGWAQELAKHNIRVNSVLPGNVIRGSGIWNEEYIAARAKQYGISPEDVETHYNKRVPLGRQCEPEDVANTVLFLVSDLSSYITGCGLLVDGGQEMK
jgi:sorbitol-6-phosphate 2-dehydrogenase